MSLTEDQLISALQKGDEHAFKWLVDTYQHMVYNTILGIVQHPQEAEDVAQEVFVQVYQSVAGFLGKSKLSTWLYRIAITKALDWERHKKRKKRFGNLLFWSNNTTDAIENCADFEHPGWQLNNKEMGIALFKAIQQLPVNQKIAFVLHYTEELSYKDIAEIMTVNIAAVEGYLHRAKQQLKTALSTYQQ